ncbi:tetratricopeptide repeat protein [Cupriavidus gilardii]|uniref:BTAD domain-containing putative transcriptional regulator n=1 Tax=Cupriavidus gilardii TaxID=82541 RepID=UPI0021B4CDEA|nr:BTAD domain-containing putative transcriptional regulator [Cupriavidus gilardii]UXC37800.1 tetratricopeptide repeat protein [Cupriavidus gilardii]
MAAVHLDLFGGFTLSSPDGTPLPLSARKARAVLAYLALADGRPQPRDKLAALLWPDSHAEQARTSLRQALSAVRRAVEGYPVVLSDADRVALCGVAVDVVAFEDHLRAATPDALEAAVALYRGDLLEGFDAAAPTFDHWLAVERERLRGLALQALARLVDRHEQAGELDRAIACATRLLTLDALQESVHRALMRLYDRQGRQALALKQYRLCRTALQRELGVSPEAETEALHQQILRARRQSSAAPSAVPPSVPPAVPPAVPPMVQSMVPPMAPTAPAARDAPAGTGPVIVSPDPGSAAAAPAPRTPEPRHAVVVVASVDDIGAHAAGLDAEQLHGLLIRWRERARALAAACGGAVTDEIGARLTVVFGVPVAHGNDAERAMHVAVGLHDGVRRLCPECATPPAVRVGVASGQVLFAAASSNGGAMTLTGPPVNVAARVMEHAQAGETVVSNRVYLALPGRLEVEHLTDVSMPGIAEPIPLWRVHRFLDAAETPPQHAFVGRQAELVQLAGVAGDCLRSGQGRVVVIRGEAGIGKSRLAERFVALGREHGMEALRALVLDFGVGTSGDPLRVLVRGLFGIDACAGVDARAAVIAQAVAGGRIDDDDVPFAFDLLDVPQPEAQAAALAAMDAGARQRGVQRFVLAQVARRSALKPLLIVVEDVHWAERALLDCLARIAAATRTCRLVLAMTVRPEQDPLDSGWRAAAGSASLTTIDLGPLNDAEARELATRYRHVDEQLADSCIRRAEGNPLFLDQLLRNAAPDTDADALPGTLQSIVLARMDRLPEPHRQALQAAAVLGQRFSPAALRHLLGTAGDPCDALVRHALLRPEGEDYLFMHALIHQAVYASLLKSRRLALHRRAADWYQGRDPMLHAEHLDAASDAGAPAAYEAAARHEAGHFRNERALRLVERALQLAGDGAIRQSLACLRGELTLNLGQPAEALKAFEHAVALAGDHGQRTRAWFGVASALRLLDRYERALIALQHAQRGAAAIGDEDMLAQIESLRGNVHFPMGDIDACLSAHQRALRHAGAAGSALGEARALGGLGDAYYQQGRMVTARAHFVRCVELARARGFVRIEGANLPMVGAVDSLCHALSSALARCDEALRIARRIGDARIELLAYDVMASTEQQTGEWAKSQAHAERALALARRLGARRFEAELAGRRALAIGNQGHPEAAEQLLDEALALSRDTGMRYSGPMILGFLARTSRDPDKQRRALAQGEAILAQSCVSHCHLDLYEAAMEVSLRNGRWDDADRYADALQAYTRPEPFPWAQFQIRRARVLAALGRGAADGGRTGLQAELMALRKEAIGAGMLAALAGIEEALRRMGMSC